MALTAQQMLDKYLEAEAAVTDGKSITFNGRTVTFENIETIRAGRREWERAVQREKWRAQSYGNGPALAEFS